MSNSAKDASEVLIVKNRKPIDRSIRTMLAEVEHENLLAPETPGSRVNRVAKQYRNIKPLLTLLGNIPLIPANWRAALLVFTQALDALAFSGTGVTSLVAPAESDDFKAGKDL